MTRALIVERAGPQMTVQDLGRPGFLSVGLSRGGGADRLALAEGAALLGQSADCAAIEMAGAGGTFTATEPIRFAVTGAEMRATLDGAPLLWNGSYVLTPGARLTIGPALAGSYGYLSVAGGIDTPLFLESRSTHLLARIGERIGDGAELPVGPDPAPGRPAMVLDAHPRLTGGNVRVVPGAQTALYSEDVRARFGATLFTRSARGNRQGVRFDFDGAPFAAEGQRTVLSEMIVPGDIQMTGQGTPFVLLPECQTTGGYPRIGSVLPEDLPIVAQAAPGTRVRFVFLTLSAARTAFRDEATRFAALEDRIRPLVRDPRDMPDLLVQQLVSGVTAGDDDTKEGDG